MIKSQITGIVFIKTAEWPLRDRPLPVTAEWSDLDKFFYCDAIKKDQYKYRLYFKALWQNCQGFYTDLHQEIPAARRRRKKPLSPALPVDKRAGKWYSWVNIRNTLTEEPHPYRGLPREPGVCCKPRRGRRRPGYHLPSAVQGPPEHRRPERVILPNDEGRLSLTGRRNSGGTVERCFTLTGTVAGWSFFLALQNSENS